MLTVTLDSFKTHTCSNCGGDYGIHQFETMKCPYLGREAYFGNKQIWMESTFDDSGLRKLTNAGPKMYTVLLTIMKEINPNERPCLLIDIVDAINSAKAIPR